MYIHKTEILKVSSNCRNTENYRPKYSEMTMSGKVFLDIVNMSIN